MEYSQIKVAHKPLIAPKAPQAGIEALLEMKEHAAPEPQLMDDSDNVAENRSLCCPGLLPCVGSIICPWFWLCGSCAIVREKQEGVALYFGKYVKTIKEPGCYCLNPCGRDIMTISTARRTTDLKDVKVAEGRGNPLIVSGVVTYSFVNTRRAALDVDNMNRFIDAQALAILKQVCSMFVYESTDPNEPSLKSEAQHIKQLMTQMLQEQVSVAGAKVHAFAITDLAYSPEISSQMLVRQSAQALVDARSVIVHGATEMAVGAIQGVKEKGVSMTPEQEGVLVGNLLVAIVSDAPVTPTVSL